MVLLALARVTVKFPDVIAERVNDFETQGVKSLTSKG
jgi:hypothetical protein